MTETMAIDNQEQEQDYYFTFGYGQEHGPRGYAVFHGTYSSARQQMVETFGQKWSFQYGSLEEAGVEKYRLVRVFKNQVIVTKKKEYEYDKQT